ncbi:MAG TPA: DUF6339 family protein [Bacteroidia bacterium]|nr:DUF6339 family protein [Bacteroidia bacterium]HRU17133.1 DUF6339 family protein [Bacteroidia bacterium]
MEKQQIFKEKYLLKLKDEIDTDKYRSNEFVYDKKQTLMMPNINKPDGLLSKLNHQKDFETAVAIFEAFKNLEPIQASDERLWSYLSHVDLYPYMVKRWPDVYTSKASKPENYIRDHWFLETTAQSNLMRHSISGLWWSVYLSVDETRTNKYELTEVLFWNQTFRTRTFGNYKLVRHKEAVIGLLEFCKENKSILKNFEKQHQILTEHLNLIGGVKPIAYYDRSFFKGELQKVSVNISSV